MLQNPGTTMSKSVVSLEKSVYLSNSSDYYPCPEALGYTIGKTLGGGRFSQVKAAWSPFEGEMVSKYCCNLKSKHCYLTC